jgi:putative flavoprotein involved in K+ transport
MPQAVDVLVVGAGQAGLAVSHELSALGVEHVVLERGLVAQTWRDRWDSFCLVTPNATIGLPGGTYAGDDPDGFLRKGEIVRHFERWAGSLRAPVYEGVAVTSLEVSDDRGFTVQTSEDAFRARAVVVCTGAYQRPHRSTGGTSADTVELDADSYANEAALPSGKVLVVGSGQTGCQIAQELHEAGREVVLSCGRAPWAPRRPGGRDIILWLIDAGFYDESVADLPSPTARLVANVQASGHNGGNDLNYRTLRDAGVTLAGRFLGAEDGQLHFASDLADSVAFGDARYADLRKLILGHCARVQIDPPEFPDPPPFDPTAPERLDVDGFSVILHTSGFRPDYGAWMHVDAFDDLGFPVQENGASTTVPGLYFCGVHFLRKRKSSLLMGVGEDAAIVAESIATRPMPRLNPVV